MLLLLYSSQLSSLKSQRVNHHFPLIYHKLIILYAFEGYILQKVPPGKWLGMNVILWGTAVAFTAAVENYRGLLVCRILLGVFEAAMPPCLMLITGEESMSFLSPSTGSLKLLPQECGIRSRKAPVDLTFGFAD
jgi:hypothetical protein